MFKKLVIVYAALQLLLLHQASGFPDGRIVNGQIVDIRRFPYIVSLRNADTGKHICGASIISENWILTAAHCVSGKVANRLNIQYGLTEIVADGVTNVMGIKRVIVHARYAPNDAFANDIALLELNGKVRFDYVNVAPVQLPTAYFEVAQSGIKHEQGWLAGWGRNDTYGIAQSNLNAVQLKIYTDKECQKRHHGATTEQQLCGGVDEGGKGQCQGDSGGPLIYGTGVQLGIVSWSIKPCTVPPYPGVYTKVSHYIDWIAQHVRPPRVSHEACAKLLQDQ